MKAEHRKELETNTLADGVGTFVRKMRQPQRGSWSYLFLGAAVLLVGLFIYWRIASMRTETSAMQWILLEDGTREDLKRVADEGGKAALAAKLQIAYITMWENGIKLLVPGQFPDSGKYFADTGLEQLDVAYSLYEDVKVSANGDPLFEPEAMFGKAVIEETRALRDRKNLDVAKELYEGLKTNHGKSAFGQLAAERLKTFDKKDLTQLYDEMDRMLGVSQRAMRPDRPEPRVKGAGTQKRPKPAQSEEP